MNILTGKNEIPKQVRNTLNHVTLNFPSVWSSAPMVPLAFSLMSP